MSYADGWAALNMQMPAHVPRTEYCLNNVVLIKSVTGHNISDSSPEELKTQAQSEFMRAWNFSFRWGAGLGSQFMKGRVTEMGHAVYLASGADFDEKMQCPFKDTEDVFSFDPFEEYGAIDRCKSIDFFESLYGGMMGKYDDAVTTVGVYTTMVSGWINIFGWEMLLAAMGADPLRFGKFARRYEEWVMPHFEALAESKIPAVMCHDDMVWTSGAIFFPSWYRDYIFPAYSRLWRPILDAGKRLVFTSDGNYTEFFDDIVKCGAHCLVMEPCSDMALFAKKYGKSHGFIGNADCRILLSGSKDDIRAEVERCMVIGKECPGFFMAVGNHIPPNTPVANALYYNEVYEELSCR